MRKRQKLLVKPYITKEIFISIKQKQITYDTHFLNENNAQKLSLLKLMFFQKKIYYHEVIGKPRATSKVIQLQNYYYNYNYKITIQ